MQDFIVSYYRSPNYIIYHFIIFIGITMGLLNFKKLTNSSKILLLLLILTPLIEWMAFYCKRNFWTNNIVYNPFTVVQFILVSTAFYKECRLKIILLLALIFLLFSIVNGLYLEPFLAKFNLNTLLLGHLLMITFFFIFLSTYFIKSDKNTLTFYPVFWVGMGLMVFSIASIIAFGIPVIGKINATWRNISLTTLRISNYLLYLSFIMAFLSPQKSLNDSATG